MGNLEREQRASQRRLEDRGDTGGGAGHRRAWSLPPRSWYACTT